MRLLSLYNKISTIFLLNEILVGKLGLFSLDKIVQLNIVFILSLREIL